MKDSIFVKLKGSIFVNKWTSLWITIFCVITIGGIMLVHLESLLFFDKPKTEQTVLLASSRSLAAAEQARLKEAEARLATAEQARLKAEARLATAEQERRTKASEEKPESSDLSATPIVLPSLPPPPTSGGISGNYNYAGETLTDANIGETLIEVDLEADIEVNQKGNNTATATATLVDCKNETSEDNEAYKEEVPPNPRCNCMDKANKDNEECNNFEIPRKTPQCSCCIGGFFPACYICPCNGYDEKSYSKTITIERYPTIECFSQVNVGKEFNVQISLTEGLITPQVKINPSPDATVTKKGQLAVSLSDDQDRWELEVVLSAPAFDFLSPDSAKIILPRKGDSTPARFRLIPKPIQKLKQVQKLRATLWHQGTYLARIVREITVTNKSRENLQQAKEFRYPTGLMSQLAHSSSTPNLTPINEKQVFNLGLQSPDMTVYLEHKISRISVHSNKLKRLAGSLAKVNGLSKWLNDNYGKFTRASQKVVVSIANQSSISQSERGRNVSLMKGFGRHLYDKYAPEEFKKAFWALQYKLGDKFDTIHIFTDDPIIPWELMIPIRGNEELDFLGIDFQIARWHISKNQELERPSQSLNLQKLFAIMPEYPDDNLAMARNELKMLQTISGFHRIGGNYNAFSKLFKTSTTDNSIVHFSGHGIVQDQRYAIKLEDGELDLMTFRGIIPHPPKTHPLFFFNACDIGQAHHVANFVDGWAPTVLEAGASGYIGGLWPLTNKGATKFAELFYHELEKSLAAGQPTNVADILRQTRKHFYDNGDPTFLGYVYYGDPHFRLVR